MNRKGIRKNEALLWFGGWTSKFGNIIFDYANSVSIVSAFAGKPWVLALYQSSETIIQVLFNLLGGAKADKGNRKRIVIITDILAAIICAALSLFVESSLMAMVMVAANALLAIVYAFNSPTYKAIIREVIEKERIGFYNSIANAGGEVIAISGPVIGVWLVGILGVRGSLLFDAATFLISALAELLLVKVEEVAKKQSNKNVLADIKDGFAYLWKEKEILFLVILASFVNFFLAGFNLLLPYSDVMYQDCFSHFYSKALAMEALGGIISSAVCARIINRFKDNVASLICFLFATGFVLALEPVMALSGNIILCLLPFALFGIALSAFNLQFMSYVQIAVDESFLGRVFSIIFTVAVIFMPFGSFVFSMVDSSRVESFYYVGGGIMLLSLFSLGIHRKQKNHR